MKSQPRQHIKKQRHYFANKDLSSQGYGSHVWIFELDYKESWALENWSFWTAVLEKILESPLDCKEIEPVHPKGNQCWIFTGRTDAKAEAPKLWPSDAKKWPIWKDLFFRERLKVGEEGDNRGWDVWMASPNQWTWVWINSKSWGDRQGSLACCSPSCKESVRLRDWTELDRQRSCLMPTQHSKVHGFMIPVILPSVSVPEGYYSSTWKIINTVSWYMLFFQVLFLWNLSRLWKDIIRNSHYTCVVRNVSLTSRMRTMQPLYLLSGQDSAPPPSCCYLHLGVSVHKGQTPAAQSRIRLSPALLPVITRSLSLFWLFLIVALDSERNVSFGDTSCGC